MRRILILLATVLFVAGTAVPVVAVTEPDTGKEYPDAVAFDCAGEDLTLKATGVGLREKTFLKVDVYTIVSYMLEGTTLDDAEDALVKLDAPKRIQMDLRRSFSCEKLKNAFTEVIDKNYEDQSAFAADIETFLAYFTEDVVFGDTHLVEIQRRRR